MAKTGDPAPKKKNLKDPWQPGQSGNPVGRPKGSRNKLGEAFTEALYADFQEHGASVIERVRNEEPAQYLRVVAGLLPKEVKIEQNPLSEMSDDELSRLIDLVRAAAPDARSAGTGDGPPKGAGVVH